MEYETQDDVSIALRKATNEVHATLEHLPINRMLFDDNFTSENLSDHYWRMISIYQPLEASLALGEPASSICYQSRLPLLERGIAILGNPPRPRPYLEPPVLGDEASRWGALYVIEGSALGGQVIHRHLATRFSPDALSFFSPHGTYTGERWRRFKSEMSKALAQPLHFNIAKSAASKIFIMFSQALS
ncbi:MAG: biliverdin-producing heme oxygenase [Rhodospirillaceae bacterium]